MTLEFVQPAMNELLAPITQRYSEVMRRVLHHYRDTATVKVRGQTYAGDGIDELIAGWCTNASICSTREFRVILDGREVVGWHDHPSEMWVAKSEQSFFDELQRDGLIRYAVPQQEGLGPEFQPLTSS